MRFRVGAVRDAVQPVAEQGEEHDRREQGPAKDTDRSQKYQEQGYSKVEKADSGSSGSVQMRDNSGAQPGEGVAIRARSRREERHPGPLHKGGGAAVSKDARDILAVGCNEPDLPEIHIPRSSNGCDSALISTPVAISLRQPSSANAL